LPVTMERHESHELIRLEGELAVTSAAELQRVLIEGLASGRELQVDLQRAEAIDITVLQLLWAAEREAARTGARLALRVSDAAAGAAREAGFERFPGLAVQE
jgi:ABC-type transporter Mla MlaB component